MGDLTDMMNAQMDDDRPAYPHHFINRTPAMTDSTPVAGTIKPLEWEANGGGYDWRAECPFGAYAITEYDGPHDDVFRARLIDLADEKIWFQTADEAKASAQADLDRRIRSCVATPANATDTAGIDSVWRGIIDAAHENIAELKAERAALRAENERLRGNLRDEQINHVAAREWVDRLLTERDRLQAELARLRSDIVALRIFTVDDPDDAYGVNSIDYIPRKEALAIIDSRIGGQAPS